MAIWEKKEFIDKMAIVDGTTITFELPLDFNCLIDNSGGIESVNEEVEVLVEDGHLLEDLSYSLLRIDGDSVIVSVTADATEFLVSDKGKFDIPVEELFNELEGEMVVIHGHDHIPTYCHPSIEGDDDILELVNGDLSWNAQDIKSIEFSGSHINVTVNDEGVERIYCVGILVLKDLSNLLVCY